MEIPSIFHEHLTDVSELSPDGSVTHAPAQLRLVLLLYYLA